MIIDKITSRQNPLIKRFRAVRQGQERHLILIEGVRLMEEALRASLHLEAVAYTDQLTAQERGLSLQKELLNLPCRGAVVTDSVMAAISDVESPPGVIAIAQLPFASLDDAITNSPPLVVIAHQLQDPGNLGTIVRSAEAAGADSLIVTPGTVNPFNFKALRAAMGSAFRLPIVTNIRLPKLAEFCQQHQLQLIAADLQGHRHTEFDWNRPVALLLGQESHGLDAAVAAFIQDRITIPMAHQVESLNVAAAASVLLFEAARQRQFKFASGEKIV